MMSIINTNEYDSTQSEESQLEMDYSLCGPQTFSEKVKNAFKKESHLDQYSASQVYLNNKWVIVLNYPYCNYHLTNLIDERVEDFKSFSILSGTWIVEFQTGYIAFEYLSQLQSSGYLWTFYPLVGKEFNLRYQPNDDNFTKQWYLANSGQNNGTSGIDLNVKNVWSEYTGNGIVIGVVDDGIDYTHLDISPNFISDYSYDYCGNDTDVMPVDSHVDSEDIIDWHGTAVAGIAAGKGDNQIGITGVAYNSSIVGIRLIAGDCDYTYEDEYTLNDLAISEALVHELQNIDIYTNSWGPVDDGQTLENTGPLTIAALEKGVSEGRDGLGAIYTWSNGNGLNNNDYSNKDGYANSRYTIAVGAINWQGEQTSYSETGPNILVSAPSYDNSELIDAAIFTTDIMGEGGNSEGNYTSVVGGTSVTTPMVAGVVALMLEANPNLTWRDVQHILVQSSQKIDLDHPSWFKTEVNRDYNNAYGYGLVDASAAVNLAENWENVGSEVSVNIGRVVVDSYITDDNNAGVTSEIFVHQSINLETIEVSVKIDHSNRGDLNLFLESPNGIISELVRENNADLEENYNNWTFTTVAHWDENSFGLWKLKVNDTVDKTSGTWKHWNMTFYGTAEPDDDEDGLPNYADSKLGTGINNPDFDGDGLLDGAEYYGWIDFVGNIHQTNPRIQDTDNDDLTDYEEGFNEVYTTDPNNNDTDGDGLFDGCEVNGYIGTERVPYQVGFDCGGHITSPLDKDTDNDTLSDFNETHAYLFDSLISNPTKKDSDNDTMPDAYELANNFDPMKKFDGGLDADMDGFDLDHSGWPPSESERFTNAMEYSLGTDPNNPDTDADGLSDGWEYYWGLDPLLSDSGNDLDNDTLSNLYEYDNRLIENSIFSFNEPLFKGYWNFEGTSPVDSFSHVGSSMAVLLNGAAKVPGKHGKGVTCDGIDDNVRFESMHSSKFTEYTVQSWVKLNNFSSGFSTVIGTATDGKTWLGINSVNNFEFKVHSSSKIYISPITNETVEAKLGIWYHLAGTYSEEGDFLRLYVNGTLVSEDVIAPGHSIQTTGTNNYMCLGPDGDDYLNGTIDNVAVWNRAFSSDEIRYVFERSNGFGNSYLYFRLDDGIRYSNPNSTDTDGDGLSDNEEAYHALDGFVTDITNPDTDGDNITDYEEFLIGTSPISNDTDSDGHGDKYIYDFNLTIGLRENQTGDAFPLDSLEWNDTDGDGVGDNSDKFPLDKTEQFDTDGDTLGDNFEKIIGTNPNLADTDLDGTNDSIDAFPLDYNEYLDTDNDGVGDNSDMCPEDKRGHIDTDNDTVCDGSDPFPLNPNEWADSDNDGYGDNSDFFPNDPSKSLKGEEITMEQQSDSGFLDSSMPIIIALGVVYFVFKYFSKKL